MGGGSLQSSGQVTGTGGYPLGGDMTAAHKKLWSGDKPIKKMKKESNLFKGPRDVEPAEDDMNAPKEYPAFGGDPNVIHGMMGTDSHYNFPPAHLNPELVNSLTGDTDMFGDPKRRGRTVSDNLENENVLDQQGHKKAPSSRSPYGQTYLQKDDPQRKREMGILQKVKKNLDKKAYTLHDPPSMGISITNPKLKDRK